MTTSSATSSQPNLPFRFFLPLLSAIVAIVPFAIDTYLPAMSVIAESLGSDMNMMQLTLSLFIGGYALGLMLFGTMSDIFGRKPVMLLGLFGYTVCALMMSFNESMTTFMILRFCQAFIGAAATVPVMGYVKSSYGANMAKGMSYVSMIMMVAPMIAPTLGVLLLGLGGWQLIFMVLSFYALVTLVMAILYIPANTPKPLTDNLFNTFFKSYAVVLGNRSVRRNIYIVGFGAFAFFGYLTAIPFVYMQVYGVSEQWFGVLFGLNVATFILGSFINTRLMPRLGSLKMVRGTLVIVALSAVVLFGVNWLGMSLYWTVIPLAIYLGSNVVLSANNDALILLAFNEQTGTATGVIGVLRFGCGALAGPVMALLYDGTAMPFCYLLMFSAAGTAWCVLSLEKPSAAQQKSA